MKTEIKPQTEGNNLQVWCVTWDWPKGRRGSHGVNLHDQEGKGRSTLQREGTARTQSYTGGELGWRLCLLMEPWKRQYYESQGLGVPREYLALGGRAVGGRRVYIFQIKTGVRVEIDMWNDYYKMFLSFLQLQVPRFSREVHPGVLSDYIEEHMDGVERYPEFLKTLRAIHE